METARARMIEKNVFMALKYSLPPAHMRLSQARAIAAALNCRFKLERRSQLFIGGDDAALI